MPLIPILTDALDAFNAAKTSGGYDALEKYLYQTVTIHRVDDATPIQGQPADIVAILNASQGATGKWPQLAYDKATLVESAVTNTVSGTGRYCDNITVGTYIKVAFIYHFIGQKIDQGSAIPIP